MASSSEPPSDDPYEKVRRAAANLYADTQAFVAEIRKTLNVIKDIAVDMERENQSDVVKKIETAFATMVETREICLHRSSAFRSIGEAYQPGVESTDFEKSIDTALEKIEASSSSCPQNHPLMLQFQQAVWNVHHAGQPMPGEEQEDIVMTSMENNIKNLKCPITGKHITELTDPVRSLDCKHIYDRNAILNFIESNHGNVKCPESACPKMLQAKGVVCDPLLLFDIEELRTLSDRNGCDRRSHRNGASR